MKMPVCLVCGELCPDFAPYVKARLDEVENLGPLGVSHEKLASSVQCYIAICYVCFRDIVPERALASTEEAKT